MAAIRPVRDCVHTRVRVDESRVREAEILAGAPSGNGAEAEAEPAAAEATAAS